MKKNLFFIVFFILATPFVHAQIGSGTVLLGGGIGFSTNKAKDTSLKNNSVYISPVIGLSVKENLIVGISFSYGNTKNTLNVPNSMSAKSYGAGLFVRKYMLLGKGFYLFGETGLYYQNYSNTYTYTSEKDEWKNQGVYINLNPGLSYAISKKFQLEVGLPQLVTFGYSKTSEAINDVATQKTNGINLNISASSFSNFALGFRIFLPK